MSAELERQVRALRSELAEVRRLIRDDVIPRLAARPGPGNDAPEGVRDLDDGTVFAPGTGTLHQPGVHRDADSYPPIAEPVVHRTVSIVSDEADRRRNQVRVRVQET